MENPGISETETEDENQKPDYEKECSICLDKWTESGIHVATKLRCGHIFGYTCIREWVKTAFGCPICKYPHTKYQLKRLYQPVGNNLDLPSTSGVNDARTLRSQTASDRGRRLDRSRSPPGPRP